MRVRWTYDLPTPGEERCESGQAPLHWDGQAILVPIAGFEHEIETRADDESARDYRIDVHRVFPDGRGAFESFTASETLLSQQWSFLQLADRLVLHVGTFHSMPGGARIEQVPFADAGDESGRGVFVRHEGALIFAHAAESRIHCHDLASLAPKWTRDFPNTSPYRVGPIALHRGQLVAHGSRALNVIDTTTGGVTRKQRVARIDKLHPPVEHEGDLLFAYTNWTSGGLLRLDASGEKVKWQFKKSGGTVASRGGALPVVGRTAILSLNDGSSLIGVDLDSGKARWSYRAQWVYTPIEVTGDSILFGTSGSRRGYLRRHHAATGETEWAVEMSGGCPYYSTEGDHVVAGDWAGVLRRIRKSDGKVVDQIDLGAPLTNEPLVVGSDVYILRWPTDGSSPALVAVSLSS